MTPYQLDFNVGTASRQVHFNNQNFTLILTMSLSTTLWKPVLCLWRILVSGRAPDVAIRLCKEEVGTSRIRYCSVSCEDYNLPESTSEWSSSGQNYFLLLEMFRAAGIVIFPPPSNFMLGS